MDCYGWTLRGRMQDTIPSAEVETEGFEQDAPFIFYCSEDCKRAHKADGYRVSACSVYALSPEGFEIKCGEEVG